jgi:hypothetical protein
MKLISSKNSHDLTSKRNILDESILEAFINHSNEMARFADPEWQEAMIEYQDHLENLKRASRTSRIANDLWISAFAGMTRVQ